MGTRMQDEGNRILNAVEEGTVGAVITLWDNQLILQNLGDFVKYERRNGISKILKEQFKFKDEQINYWLGWFKVD